MSGQSKGLQLLDEIRPPAPKRRFLQSWDRDARVLRFGCGDENKAVQIGSDGAVEPVEAAQATKLRTSTIREFLNGTTTESPLADVQATLRKYLYFADPRIYTLLAVWIAGTYVYSIFSHFGYLFLHSQHPRCGKTRAEEVTSHLAFEATTPRNAPTPPTMRETAVAGGTAIFDTLERWKEKGKESFGAAMELLDAGFRNGGVVTKMISTGPSDWRQELYPVYAPYMFAAIDQRSLTDTALDRSFVIDMVRKSTKLKTRPYDARCEAECEPIREKLYLMALTHAARIADVYESPELQREVDTLGLNDRASDIWKPLIAITRALGEDAIANELGALAQEMSPDPDRQDERRQLSIAGALRAVAGPEGTITGTTQQITEMLRQVTNVDCSELHGVLVGWGFTDKSMRLTGIDTPRKGWEITDRELATIETNLNGEGYSPRTGDYNDYTVGVQVEGAAHRSNTPMLAAASGAREQVECL